MIHTEELRSTTRPRMDIPAAVVAMSGGLAVVGGTFLPWVQFSAGFSNESTAGISHEVGIETMAGGAAILLFGGLMLLRRGRVSYALLLFLAAAFEVGDLVSFFDRARQLAQQVANSSDISQLTIQAGPYLMALGTAAAFVGGVIALARLVPSWEAVLWGLIGLALMAAGGLGGVKINQLGLVNSQPTSVPVANHVQQSPTSTTSTTFADTSVPQAGCLSLQDLSDIIAEAADSYSVTPLENMDDTQGSPWWKITSMEAAGPTGVVPLASDTRNLIGAYAGTISSGDLSQIENADQTVTADCQSLGLPTGPGG